MAKRRRKSKCALCHNIDYLERSHIISKFHTKYLYRKRKPQDIIAISEKGKSRIRPDGHWQHLLCKPCDSALGKESERVASQVLYYGKPKIIENSEHGSVFRDLDYPSFRLYCLSTLWKMSVSSIDYFNKVDLGEEMNEFLRLAILYRDTLDQRFPFTFARLMINENDFQCSIKPFTLKRGRHKSIILVTNGILMECHYKGYENNGNKIAIF